MSNEPTGHVWSGMVGTYEPHPEAVDSGWLPEGFGMKARTCLRCGATEVWKKDSADKEWELASVVPGMPLRKAHGPCGAKGPSRFYQGRNR